MNFTFYEIAWYFCIYAMLGWCVEVCFCTVNTGKFVNRGFLNGPVCPIYGFGMVIILLALTPLADHLLALYIGAVLLTSALELVTGFVLKKLFHTTWWDYTDVPFNIGGYVCLKFSLMWGVGGVVVIKALHPLVEKFVQIMPHTLGVIALCFIAALFICDLIVTVNAIAKMNKDLGRIAEIAAKLHAGSDVLAERLGDGALVVDEKLDDAKLNVNARFDFAKAEWADKKHFVQARLLKAFPDMKNSRYAEALVALKEWYAKKQSNKKRGESRMKTTPIKGTKDYLPREMRMRDYVQGEILRTYRASGFERIGTPMIEDMENLDKSEGGDNLNLIFKIMKRGEKLEKALAAGSEKDLCDMGLRYDLTLPLSRYYAANKEQLPNPFKVIQTDRVFRAERPQKGRMREFVQCDIDILGDVSPNAEIELIDVTARALLNIGFGDFAIHINDRRLLRGMLESFGFAANELDSVCITFDKLDKIGADGVCAELTEKGFAETAVAALGAFLAKGSFTLQEVSALCTDQSLGERLQYVIDSVKAVAGEKYEIIYMPSLVRGQGYYTGMVFEIASKAFSGAVGGGGRYDNMVGKFLGQDVPAVGFSIGFERIAGILLEQGYEIPAEKSRLALLYSTGADFAAVLKTAEALRETYSVTVLAAAKKVGKQIDKLQADGYNALCFAEKYPEIKTL